jgi:multiple sugar transport system substrate-binding protein
MRLIGLLAVILLGGCTPRDDRTEIVVQRFFGECGAAYGRNIDIAKAETECGILTTIINRFQAENPDVRVKVNVVAWPGYPQLAAQIAAGDPPDLVTMHQSVISDYSGRGLLEPVDEVLARAGMARGDLTDAGLRGTLKGGRLYAMPWDTIGRLFHINTALMAKAGLMKDGRPVLPRSADELLAHARRFKAATGRPYLIQAQVNAPDTHVGILYTYLLAQGAVIFPDARTARLDTPEARRVVGPVPTDPSRRPDHARPGLPGRPCKLRERGGRHLPDGHLDDRGLRGGGSHAGPALERPLRRASVPAALGRGGGVRRRTRLGHAARGAWAGRARRRSRAF